MIIMDSLKAYNRRFPDGFPTIPLLQSKGEAWCMKIIQHCLDAGKDVYEMGYLEEPEDNDVYI